MSTWDVIPFTAFKDQISVNYKELQKNTTKMIIKRLGLGTVKPDYADGIAQTSEDYVDPNLLSQCRAELWDKETAFDKL